MKKFTLLLITLTIFFSCSDSNDDVIPDDQDDTQELNCAIGGMIAEITGAEDLSFVAIGTDRDNPDGGGFVTGNFDGIDLNFRGSLVNNDGTQATHQIEISILSYNSGGVGDYSDKTTIGYSNIESDEYYQSINDGSVSLQVTEIDFVTNDFGCITVEFSCNAFSTDGSKTVQITGKLKMETDI